MFSRRKPFALFISVKHPVGTGGEVISSLNWREFQATCNKHGIRAKRILVLPFYLSAKISSIQKIGLFASFLWFGLTIRHISFLSRLCRHYDIRIVWLDASYHFWLPVLFRFVFKIKTITHFHNIEPLYWFADFRYGKINSIFSFLHSVFAHLSCTVLSDKLVFLSCREFLLHRSFFSIRKIHRLPPLFPYQDKLPTSTPSIPFEAWPASDSDLLFLGSAFFGNIQALRILLKSLSCLSSSFQVHVIGRGFDQDVINSMSVPSNVKVIVHGFVDNLSLLKYLSRVAVVPWAPGAGMKIKIGTLSFFGLHVFCHASNKLDYDYLATYGVNISYYYDAKDLEYLFSRVPCKPSPELDIVRISEAIRLNRMTLLENILFAY